MAHSIAHIPCETDAISICGQPLLLWRPVEAEKLVLETTQEQFGDDERMPYWAILWPASIALAEFLVECVDLEGKRVLELGAGLAVPGLAAARAGAQVIATDWFEEPLEFVQSSARLNGITIETRQIDWRYPPEELQFDLIVGADLLYERRNHEAILACMEALLAPNGVAVLADPVRHMTPTFIALAEARGWSCSAQRVDQSFEGTKYAVDCWVMRRG